jgi:hypothetical protein
MAMKNDKMMRSGKMGAGSSPKTAKTQAGKKQWETPQVQPKQLFTKVKGGDVPDKDDIMMSANARGMKRHDAKGQDVADVGVLPDSSMMKNNEMVGVRDDGYLVKKNLPYGNNANYNSLPPGMDIEDQEVCDIRRMEMKVYKGGVGYPGDGWADPETSKMDMGRPDETNYSYGGKF